MKHLRPFAFFVGLFLFCMIPCQTVNGQARLNPTTMFSVADYADKVWDFMDNLPDSCTVLAVRLDSLVQKIFYTNCPIEMGEMFDGFYNEGLAYAENNFYINVYDLSTLQVRNVVVFDEDGWGAFTPEEERYDVDLGAPGISKCNYINQEVIVVQTALDKYANGTIFFIFVDNEDIRVVDYGVIMGMTGNGITVASMEEILDGRYSAETIWATMLKDHPFER